MMFNENLIQNNKFVLKMQEIMDDFGAPSGQIQISLTFNHILIKNGRFRSSHWPDPNFIHISLNSY